MGKKANQKRLSRVYSEKKKFFFSGTYTCKFSGLRLLITSCITLAVLQPSRESTNFFFSSGIFFFPIFSYFFLTISVDLRRGDGTVEVNELRRYETLPISFYFSMLDVKWLFWVSNTNENDKHFQMKLEKFSN